jgi:hypothetical protein
VKYCGFGLVLALIEARIARVKRIVIYSVFGPTRIEASRQDAWVRNDAQNLVTVLRWSGQLKWVSQNEVQGVLP